MRIERGKSRLGDWLLDNRQAGSWWEPSWLQLLRWLLFRYDPWLLGLTLWTPNLREYASAAERATIPTALVFLVLVVLVALGGGK